MSALDRAPVNELIVRIVIEHDGTPVTLGSYLEAAGGPASLARQMLEHAARSVDETSTLVVEELTALHVVVDLGEGWHLTR